MLTVHKQYHSFSTNGWVWAQNISQSRWDLNPIPNALYLIFLYQVLSTCCLNTILAIWMFLVAKLRQRFGIHCIFDSCPGFDLYSICAEDPPMKSHHQEYIQKRKQKYGKRINEFSRNFQDESDMAKGTIDIQTRLFQAWVNCFTLFRLGVTEVCAIGIHLVWYI